MNATELNKWCSPETAKLWPEGSQIVWRRKLATPSYEKHYDYEESGWFRPDWIGAKDYLWNDPGLEFMLLELPIKRRTKS